MSAARLLRFGPRLLAAALLAGSLTSEAAAKPRRVVSLNLCTDQLVLMLAEAANVAAVSYLSRDSASVSLSLEHDTEDLSQETDELEKGESGEEEGEGGEEEEEGGERWQEAEETDTSDEEVANSGSASDLHCYQ